jgi:iron complex outermembrane receptor protein
LPFLKGLEVQLAVRDDSQSNDFSVAPDQPGSARVRATFTGAAYTIGAKVSPVSWLMVRGSFATGETPPPSSALIPRVDPEYFGFPNDPKRGGAFGDFAEYADQDQGSPHLKNVLASTVAVGVVLTPFGPHVLQLSLDYSHIRKTHDVLFLSDDLVLAHEDYWPQRVQRGPLTDEDRALGYTGGPITAIDATAINGASRDVQTLDARFDWTFAAPVGWLHLYGGATYNFDDIEKGLFSPNVVYDDAIDGPLMWRANGGADWSLGSLTIGVNVQYYGSSSIFLSSETDDFVRELSQNLQGSDRIPAQAYLDLHISKRFSLHNTDLRVDFGINDVLDTSAPRVNSTDGFGYGVSQYGDPRRRRFELSISAAF